MPNTRVKSKAQSAPAGIKCGILNNAKQMTIRQRADAEAEKMDWKTTNVDAAKIVYQIEFNFTINDLVDLYIIIILNSYLYGLSTIYNANITNNCAFTNIIFSQLNYILYIPFCIFLK